MTVHNRGKRCEPFVFSTIVGGDGGNRYREVVVLFTDQVIRKSHNFILIRNFGVFIYISM